MKSELNSNVVKKPGVSVALAGLGMAIALTAGGLAGVSAANAASRAEVYLGDGKGGTVPGSADRLVSMAESRGTVPVIVSVKTDFVPEGDLSMFAAANQRAAISSLQRRVLSRVAGEQNVKAYETVPMVAMTVDAAGIEALLSDPNVESIAEDTLAAPTLNESVPLIGAKKVWKRYKKTGKGWVVAVLDTGADLKHPAFNKKIVAGACYSTTNVSEGSESACPGGAQSSTTKKSGKYCNLGVSGCDHGTHVSGIAVGNPKTPYKGVAKKAKLIPVQVFSEFDNTNYCGSNNPCALTWTSDQIAGLERIYKLRKKYKIASINMSLGGGQYSGYCKSDVRRPIIKNLRKAKIATVIASGNNGYTGSISAPSCIPEAITVGSTTKSDFVASYSNHSKQVDVMAPGSDIYAPVPKKSYGYKSGTSMATPHAAGTWALLKQRYKGATVTEIEKALECSGPKVSAGGIKKPRIQVDKAYKKVGVC